MAEITIGANIEGVEDVQAGFQEIGDSADEMGNKIEESSTRASMGYSTLMRSQATVLTQSMSMAHVLGQVAAGHLSVASGLVMLLPHMLRMSAAIVRIVEKHGEEIIAQAAVLAGDIRGAAAKMASAIATGAQEAATWLLTAATKAYAIAQAIADALTPLGWAVLAGAVAAAAIGVTLAMTIPSKQAGGLISSTGPYLLHAGEFVSPAGTTGRTVHIYISDPVFRSKSDLDYLVDRLKRMGMA